MTVYTIWDGIGRQLSRSLLFLGIALFSFGSVGIPLPAAEETTKHAPELVPPVFSNEVIFNRRTKKYHNENCEWAKRCTKSCVRIKRQEAIEQGGVPCKVCNANVGS